MEYSHTQSLIDEGKIRDAEKILLASIPTTETYIQLSRIYMELNEVSIANRFIKQTLNSNPDQYQYYCAKIYEIEISFKQYEDTLTALDILEREICLIDLDRYKRERLLFDLYRNKILNNLHNGKYSETIELINKIEQITRIIDDNYYYSIYYHYSGLLNDYQGNLILAYENYVYSIRYSRDKYLNRYSATLHNLAIISTLRGFYQEAINYCDQEIELLRSIENIFYINLAISEKGWIYFLMNNYKKSMELFFIAYNYFSDQSDIFILTKIISRIIILYSTDNNITMAGEYLDILRSYVINNKSIRIHLNYIFAEAIYLKATKRLRNIAKAMNKLKEIITNYDLDTGIYIYSLDTLCDLLIMEYQLSYDDEILEEISYYCDKLEEFAVDHGSITIFVKYKIIMAKFVILQNNFEEAENLLHNAIVNAENYNLKHLSLQISDELERIQTKLVSKNILDDKITEMIYSNIDRDNNSTAIFVIDQSNGELIYALDINLNKDFDNQHLTNFINAIIKFGEDALNLPIAVNSVNYDDMSLLIDASMQYTIVYVFTGQTYLARRKLDKLRLLINKNINKSTTELDKLIIDELTIKK